MSKYIALCVARCTLGVAGLAAIMPAGAAVIYVDAAASGAMSGTSWANAYTDIQSALNAATANDEIRVAQGTYTPSLRTDALDVRSKTYMLIGTVSVKGGYGGVANGGDADGMGTILDGSVDNVYHVVTAASANDGARPMLARVRISGGIDNARLPLDPCPGSPHHVAVGGGGLYVSDGNGTYTDIYFDSNVARSLTLTLCGGSDPLANGGGALIEGGTNRINGCTFDNTVANNGGGIALINCTSAVVTNCRWAKPSVYNNGYGACAYVLSGSETESHILFSMCQFAGNTDMCSDCSYPDYGGGLYADVSDGDVRVERCSFVDCIAKRAGGGVWLENGDLFLSRGWFTANQAGAFGGAIGVGGVVGGSGNGDARITNCKFGGDLSDLSDDGASVGITSRGTAAIMNCFMIHEEASDVDAAVVANGGVMTMVNCTLRDNDSSTYDIRTDSSGTSTIQNTIVWGGGGVAGAGTIAVQYSDTSPGHAGTGNISTNPVFSTIYDHKIADNSPCVDVGHNSDILPDSCDLNADSNDTSPTPFCLMLGTLSQSPVDVLIGDEKPRILASVVDIGAYETGCPCFADFDGDGDTGTDADITAFFAAIGGTRCPTCMSTDVNCDGDFGTDADITLFFQELGGGGPC